MLLASIAVVALIAGCASTSAGPSASASGNKPIVLIQAPVNGAVVAVGQTVTVTGTASDTVGVDHVALFSGSVSVASTPSAAPAPTVPFSLTWLATPTGPHALQVIAYRADGTQSDPAVVNIVVGVATGSGIVPGTGIVPPSLARPTLPPPPPATKKPRPSKAPPPPATAAPSTAATAEPTDTVAPATAVPPTSSPLPTMDASGNAPDDTASEPYQIVLDPANTAGCPTLDPSIPTAAIGCLWEQISSPSGDTTDTLYFVPIANTYYHSILNSCSDTSTKTEWFFLPFDQNTFVTGCGGFINTQVGTVAPPSINIQVDINISPQTYNLYQFTVYQCAFTNCGSS